MVETNLGAAIRTIQTIDLLAVEKLKHETPLLKKLHQQIDATLDSGHRVFLSGCGATGRLALSLETIWRQINAGEWKEDRVQGLMAGGDFALVKSVENFEDFPEYGIRHLQDLGFIEGDLLIAITEGGETPWVIGTVHGALATSKNNPWFVYCNPPGLLSKTVERSREIIEHPRVHQLCIDTGPMALSGSTRLQAATVQMLGVGAALLNRLDLIDEFLIAYKNLDLSFLEQVVKWESERYLQNEVVLYQTNSYPIAVLTDTTERSPTFSLTPFEKSTVTQGPYSLCYLSIPDAHTAIQSWKAILNRSPIGLEWPELGGRLGLDAILEFNFGREAIEARAKRVAPQHQAVIRIDGHHTTSELELKTSEFDLRVHSSLVHHPLTEQILVKVLLNTLSLMVMGKLGRYEGNVMTWVRASNGKLIDRTIRYLEFLLEKRGLAPISRDELAQLIFEKQAEIQPDQAVILEILFRYPTTYRSPAR